MARTKMTARKAGGPFLRNGPRGRAKEVRMGRWVGGGVKHPGVSSETADDVAESKDAPSTVNEFAPEMLSAAESEPSAPSHALPSSSDSSKVGDASAQAKDDDDDDNEKEDDEDNEDKGDEEDEEDDGGGGGQDELDTAVEEKLPAPTSSSSSSGKLYQVPQTDLAVLDSPQGASGVEDEEEDGNVDPATLSKRQRI